MGFCPVCGKSIPRGEVFCDDHKPVKVDFKPFELKVCSCGRIFSNNHWFFPNSINDSVLKIARAHVKDKNAFVSIPELLIPEKRGSKVVNKLFVSVGDNDFVFDFVVRNEQCDKCARIGTNYFTAKLQLRNPPPEALPFVESFLKPLASRGVAVNKVEDTPRGPDLFLTSKKAASQLGEKLVRRFGGVLKLSEKLFSRNRQTSKNIYRLNVLVQFPLFKVGDVISLNGRVVLVTGLGKFCTGRDLLRDKKVVFVAGDEDSVLEKYSVVINNVRPRVEISDPVSFQQVPLLSHSGFLSSLRPGDRVFVVSLNNKWFFVPDLIKNSHS